MNLADCIEIWLRTEPIGRWKIIREVKGVKLNWAYLVPPRYNLMDPKTPIGCIDEGRVVFASLDKVFRAEDPNFFAMLKIFLRQNNQRKP